MSQVTFLDWLNYFSPNQTYSAESIIDGKIHREIEFTMYAQVNDFTFLKDAVVIERHEQWTVPFLNDTAKIKGRIRLVDDIRPIFCTKYKSENMVGVDECEIDISMDMFNQLRKVATDGYKKTRYKFKTPDPELMWEVDVFQNMSGNPHDWIKIDLEVNDVNKSIPKFPFDVVYMIFSDDPNLPAKDKQLIRKLWDIEWQRIDGVRKDLDQL